ncbi:uncharacterized protein RCO7_01401 [Rhynchosporium graminicola]|uniref:DUS-like FMN-binding domain-containing protein n=1 Tax=Rhynchosporium graminicola TaxID=2792576 RepID=A0A1E1JZ38_9HELO|nr:uncharacterized protein RCO7_01401 [Rhynchosporium commune]
MIASAKSTLQTLSLTSSFISSDKESERYKTVSVKIRIHKDLRKTLDFVREVENAGVDFITVHGRMRSTRSSEPVNLDAIKLVKEHARVPIVANGDVFSRADVERIVSETGVDGVMSARGLLEEPGLFARSPTLTTSKNHSAAVGEGSDDDQSQDNRWEVLETFLNNVIRAPIPFKLVVHHISEMVGSDRLQTGRGLIGTLFTKEERAALMECKSFLEVLDLVDGVRGVRRF